MSETTTAEDVRRVSRSVLRLGRKIDRMRWPISSIHDDMHWLPKASIEGFDLLLGTLNKLATEIDRLDAARSRAGEGDGE